MHPEYALNVSAMHATLQDELTTAPGAQGGKDANAMKTLNLRLDEVAHIRSVLTKAELEGLPLDGNVRENVEKGKVSKRRKKSQRCPEKATAIELSYVDRR